MFSLNETKFNLIDDFNISNCFVIKSYDPIKTIGFLFLYLLKALNIISEKILLGSPQIIKIGLITFNFCVNFDFVKINSRKLTELFCPFKFYHFF